MLRSRINLKMSASFAKAVMPRVRREGEPRGEGDWVLGWIYPENTEQPLAAEFESPVVSVREAGEATAMPPVADDISH